MSDIDTTSSDINGVWVFQADINSYNYWEKFQEGIVENWYRPTKKGKIPGQIILFRQTQAPPEKSGIYGIGELVDTDFKGKGLTKGVRVRYLKRFEKFMTLGELRERAKKIGIDKNEDSKIYQFIFRGHPSTDIWFEGEDYDVILKILPELKEFPLKREGRVIENDVETHFQKWIEQEGGQILGTEDSTTAKTVGWPDFAVRIGKKVTFYEIKSVTDKVTESQREILRMLRGLGADVKILFYVDGEWDDRTKIWLD